MSAVDWFIIALSGVAVVISIIRFVVAIGCGDKGDAEIAMIWFAITAVNISVVLS